jgi:transcriptional regulator with XRE-family HTH domain
MDIGERIKILRKSKKLNGKVFSASIGKTSGWLSMVEKGQITPSNSIVMLIESKYGVRLTADTESFTATTQGKPVAGVNERAVSYSGMAPDIRIFVEAVVEILTTPNEYSGALKENILAFQRAVRHDKEVSELRREVDALKKVLRPGGSPGNVKETSSE